MAQTRLQAVDETQLIGQEPRPVLPPPQPRGQSVLTNLLALSLRALSQRALVAASALVDLALVGSAFALSLMIIAAPTVNQLVLVAGYAIFIVACILLRKRA